MSPCGRIRLPSFCEIEGKMVGVLVCRDGRRVRFSELSTTLAELPGIKQYQVVQEAIEEFTVRLVVKDGKNLAPLITEAFRRYFGYDPDITVEYLSSIPREPNGKFHLSICRV